MDMEIKKQMLDMVNHEELINMLNSFGYTSNLDLTRHLDKWATNKQHLFKLFGNKLRVESSELVDMPKDDFCTLSEKFIQGLIEDERYRMAGAFLKYISQEELRRNLLTRNEILRFFGQDFQKGMRVSKCFNHLVKKEHLEQLKIDYSMFIQSTKSKGTVALSIDPKDYLTMSENNSGWSSCHSMCGEYRSGTLSYMMDTSSAISYIIGSSNPYVTQYNRKEGEVYSYANKSWRQIVLIDELNKYALQLKEYPYSSVINSNSISGLLKDLLSKWNKNKEYEFSSAENDKYFRAACHNKYDYLYYSDVDTGNFKVGVLTAEKNVNLKTIGKMIKIDYYKQMEVGEEVPCIIAGCSGILEGDNSLYCEDCGGDSWDD